MQLFVCCDDPQGLLPPCLDCRDTVWAAPTPRSDGFRASWPGVGVPRVDRQPGRSSSGAGGVDSGQDTVGSRAGGFQATKGSMEVEQRATVQRLLAGNGGNSSGRGGGGAGSSTNGSGRGGPAGSGSGAACGFELGRWVTPFRRGSGEWLTDVTPLLPLLPTNRCDVVQCSCCSHCCHVMS